MLSHRRYVTFIIGGGIGLALNIGITFILTALFSIWHMASYLFALAFSTIFVFAYHRRITFNNPSRTRRRFAKFALLTLLLVALNWLLVLFLTEALLVYYIFAIIGVTFAISIINYYFNKLWVFRNDGLG